MTATITERTTSKRYKPFSEACIHDQAGGIINERNSMYLRIPTGNIINFFFLHKNMLSQSEPQKEIEIATDKITDIVFIKMGFIRTSTAAVHGCVD